MHSESIEALEDKLPPDEGHILGADGARLDHTIICPYSRKARWIRKHNAA